MDPFLRIRLGKMTNPVSAVAAMESDGGFAIATEPEE